MMRIGWNSAKKKVGIGRLIDCFGLFWLAAIRLAHLLHKNPAEMRTPC